MRLAVGVGQKRHVAPFLRAGFQGLDELVESRTVHLLHRFAYRHGHCGVVDVLACQAEMDEFLILRQPHGVEALFDEVFHSLDVVVGGLFDFLDLRCVLDGKVSVYLPQGCEHRPVDAGELRQRKFAQSDEILHFDAHPVADKGIFRKIFVKTFAF